MKLEPLQNFVVIKELEEKERSGIILPEDIDKERNQGEIVAEGGGCILPVGIGDKVLFRSYGFDKIELEGEKYLIGEEKNIIARLV